MNRSLLEELLLQQNQSLLTTSIFNYLLSVTFHFQKMAPQLTPNDLLTLFSSFVIMLMFKMILLPAKII